MNRLKSKESSARKHVFVCGLQRSGTSVLARNIGRFPDCTSFKHTGVPQDEGQYLQDIYLTDTQLGGNPRYGFDPRAHLTEQSPLLTPANIAKLHDSWDRYWDPGKSICLEKTPGNLIMTRFLQAAFPHSYFIVIRRHPVPVAMANQRWAVSVNSLHVVFEHWLRCYGLFDQDKEHLKHIYELRYEDYVKSPRKYHEEIARFIGTAPAEEYMENISDVHNKKYFNRWAELQRSSPFKIYYRYIACAYESKFTPYEYSLLSMPDVQERSLCELNGVSIALGSLCCFIADTYKFTFRSAVRFQWYVKRQLRARLPELLKTRIKHLLRRQPAGE